VEVAAAPGSIAAVMNATTREPLLKVNAFKAIVPLVPILLLLFVKPHVPLPSALKSSDGNTMGEQAAIAAAMITGVCVAAALAHKRLDGLSSAFFEGAGFTFVHVIPVIAGATMFARGVEMNGLIESLANALRRAPGAIGAATIATAWLMAMVTGTAVGTAPLVINMMLPIATGGAPMSNVPLACQTGGLASVAAQFGRTSSPVAPVTIMCAVLSRQKPNALMKRVLIPLSAGAIVLFITSLLWR
jgi:C4-dicarboxylate transporter